jgi:NlpC/P60 family
MRQVRGKLRRSKARGLAVGAGLLCVCLLGGLHAEAQVTAAVRASGSDSTSRLLNVREGRSIADAAREQNELTEGTQDCSHVVHQIYLDAGFEYPYASSFDIYAGNESFQRVRFPQAGDLIVWPGHLGIVLDPAEHSFYSLVSTGLEAQNYEGHYWKSRGRPRFYRYRIGGAGIASGAGTSTARQVSNTVKQRRATPVVAERSSAESSDSNTPPKAVSNRTPPIYGPLAPAAAANAATAFEVPPSILIAAGNKPPAREDVAAGISELSNAAGNVLRTDEPLKPTLPVVIVERFSVERIEIKRDRGWAYLQIDSKVSIADGEAHVERQREKIRWELRRTESGWEAVAPPDRTYVQEDVAVKYLAAQLAHLTGSDGPAAHQEMVLRQESQLVKLLSALLETK